MTRTKKQSTEAAVREIRRKTRLCDRDKQGTKVHDEEPFESDGLGSPSSGSIPASASRDNEGLYL
jgi:hypothetical protein